MANKAAIVFTGGGSSGHVTPNIALIELLRMRNGVDIGYIGSKTGIEKELIQKIGVPYYTVSTDKLRREFTLKNLLIPFKLCKGVIDAYQHLGKIKPKLLFSKGGFVAVPVVIAAFLRKIPIIIHESDLSPGLANRLSFPFATHICISFDCTKDAIKHKAKVIHTGSPIRQSVIQGDADRARAQYKIEDEKIVLLVIGGGLGSVTINKLIRKNIETLTTAYHVVHICGKGKVDASVQHPFYTQLEYVNEGYGDLLAVADIVISRAGANSIAELLYVQKPHLLIPLSVKASRGDQLENATYYVQKQVSAMLLEADLSGIALLEALNVITTNRQQYKEKMQQLPELAANSTLLNLILGVLK